MYLNRNFGILIKLYSKTPALLAAAALVCCADIAAAGETPQYRDNATGPVFTLGEVVVEGEADTISKVTTVDTVKKETMELNTATNVADAIKSVPGVVLTTGAKNEKTFSIRGFTQRYVPVFYDGIPIYTPFDGYVDMGKLPTGNISQIDISKGISSVLYGPNALGGVVNIVSRKPEKKLEADFDVGWSEGSRWDTNVNLGSRMGKFYFMGSYGYTDQDAFLLSDHHRRAINQQGNHRRDNSYIENQNSGSCKIGFTPADGHEYAVGWAHVKSDWGLPPQENTVAPWWRKFTEWKKDTYYFIGDTKITDNLQLKTRVYRDEYYNVLDAYDNNLYATQDAPNSFHSTYDDYSNGGSLVLRTTYIPRNTVSASFNYKQDVHREQDDYYYDWERYETKTYSYGLEDDIKITDRLSFVAGAGYDKNVQTYANGYPINGKRKDSFNPQAGFNYALTDNTVLHLSVGKKSRFPSLKELYSSLIGTNVPNPDLKAERTVNYEAGIDQALPGDTNLKFALFYSDVKNLIVNREITLLTVKQFQNIGEAKFKGFEFSLKSGWLLNNNFELHYTWLHDEDRSANRTSNHLEYIPKHNLYMSDLYTINKYLSVFSSLTLNSSKHYQGTLDDENMQWGTIGGFCTVDMKVIGKITKYFTLEAGARNLFDEDYQYTNGFPSPGRTFFTILRGKLW